MLEKINQFLSDRKPFSKPSRGHGRLEGFRVAILATDGFEASELFVPMEKLAAEGCETRIVSLFEGKIKSWKGENWGKPIVVDLTVQEAASEYFDALVLPGGVMNPDALREDKTAVDFVESFVREDKPIAAICHGVQTLIETGAVEGKTLTSYPSLLTDLINAGAEWVDREVVVDGYLITSRRPDDLPAFCQEMLRVFAEHKNIRAIPDTESFVSIR